jgi:hypothetical protein
MKRTATPHEVDLRLREEARVLRNTIAYSPLLHERIMDSLRRTGLDADAGAAARRFSWWRVALPAGIAAAVAVATWIALRPAAPNPPQQIVRQPVPTQPAPIPEAPASLTPADIATNTLERGKYAYLDRDANRLFTFVANQIPSFPEPK